MEGVVGEGERFSCRLARGAARSRGVRTYFESYLSWMANLIHLAHKLGSVNYKYWDFRK